MVKKNQNQYACRLGEKPNGEVVLKKVDVSTPAQTEEVSGPLTLAEISFIRTFCIEQRFEKHFGVLRSKAENYKVKLCDGSDERSRMAARSGWLHVKLLRAWVEDFESPRLFW